MSNENNPYCNQELEKAINLIVSPQRNHVGLEYDEVKEVIEEEILTNYPIEHVIAVLNFYAAACDSGKPSIDGICRAFYMFEDLRDLDTDSGRRYTCKTIEKTCIFDPDINEEDDMAEFLALENSNELATEMCQQCDGSCNYRCAE